MFQQLTKTRWTHAITSPINLRNSSQSHHQFGHQIQPRIKQYRTKSPLWLPTSQEKGHTETIGLGQAPFEPKIPKPNATQSRIEHQLESNSTPKIPNGFYYKNINFPSLIFRNPTKQPVWTRIKSWIEAHEWDLWPLTFKIDSKLDFFKNPTRKCKKNGVKVVVLNSYVVKWWF